MKKLVIIVGGVVLVAGSVYLIYKLFRHWRNNNEFMFDYDIEDENIFLED